MGDSNAGWGVVADSPFGNLFDSYEPLPEPGTFKLVDEFCERKHITNRGLRRLGTRLHVGDETELVFPVPGGLKYRSIMPANYGGRRNASGSEFTGMFIVAAGPEPTDLVLVAEGETDAAWLTDHYDCDVAVLPAGAATIKPQFVDQLRPYRLVLAALDSDRRGNEGAAKLAESLPGKVRRWPPPAKDWCSTDLDYEPPELPAPPSPVANLMTMDEVISMEMPVLLSHLSDNVLPVGGMLVIHGWTKSFKSWIAFDMLAKLAEAQPWATFEPMGGPLKVAVMQYEITPGYYQQRLTQMRANANSPAVAGGNYLTWRPDSRPHFVAGDTASEDEIIESLVAAGVSVFLLDPIRQATGAANINDEAEMHPLRYFFQRVMQEKITVVTCHHDTKSAGRAGGGREFDMTGAGAFAGDADTIVSVERPRDGEPGQRNLNFRMRNGPEPSPKGMQIMESGLIVYGEPHCQAEDDEADPGLPRI